MAARGLPPKSSPRPGQEACGVTAPGWDPQGKPPRCSGHVPAGRRRPAGRGYLQPIYNTARTFLSPGFAGPQISSSFFFFFWQGFSTTPKAALPKPRHHHPCPADAGVSPAGLTCRTRVWMPDTILHLNSCRFAALWHFQGEQGSRVHHFAVIKINLHLHGTWVPPKRRHKWRKGAFLPLLEIPHLKNSAPKNGEGKPSRPPSCGLSCCMHLTEAVSATGGQ